MHQTSYDLGDSVGLNAHFETLALNDDPRTTQAVFKFISSNVRHFRTPIFKLVSNDSWWTNRHHDVLRGLTDNGVKLTALFGWLPLAGQADRTASAEQVMSIVESTYAGKVVAFEGPNEPDNPQVNPGAPYPDWMKWTLEQHVAIRQARDKRPALRSIPIVGPSPIGGLVERTKLGPIDFMVDAINCHPYTGNKPSLQSELAQHLSHGAPSCPNGPKPMQATEYGYTLAPAAGTGWNPIDERQQAILTIRQILAHAKAGITRSFYYDFIDDGVDPGHESRFGLLRYDLSERPAYRAVQKLLSLCDTTQTAPVAPLNWTLTGAPADAKSLVLSNADGTRSVFIWREAPLGTAAVTAQVTFPGKTHKVSYDLINGSPDCPYDFPDGYAFNVVLSDDPVVFRV